MVSTICVSSHHYFYYYVDSLISSLSFNISSPIFYQCTVLLKPRWLNRAVLIGWCERTWKAADSHMEMNLCLMSEKV